MKRVITFGTFDLFHIGHLKILEKAKKMGDYLIVGVSSDSINWKKKKKKTNFFFRGTFRNYSFIKMCR